VEFERLYRLELPGVAPDLDVQSALWGAETLYRLCQILVFRAVGPQQADALLLQPSPDATNASVVYSVDVTMRYLPDVCRLTKAASVNDPWIDRLAELAGDWPLSSVGVENVALKSIEAIACDPCLKRLYVDRIIAATDRSRISDPQIRSAVKTALGAHCDWAPTVYSWVEDFAA
jgi:hypothetical protein